MPIADLIEFDLQAVARLAADAGSGTLGIVGADEVGRGCLAGPITACAVRLELSVAGDLIGRLKGLGDSKKLIAAKRETLEPLIQESAAAYHIATRSSEEIDDQGIQPCNMGVLRESVEAVYQPGDVVLIDGFRVKDLRIAHEQVIKGDGKSAAIAAASVLAKVDRDRVMRAAAVQHPGYGFETNAGYGSPKHIQALAQLGLTPLHRRSFRMPGLG